MRKQTETNDSRENKASEANPSETRRHVTRSQTDSRSEVACPSNTLPISSQSDETVEKESNCSEIVWESVSGAAAIDWWELGACVQWDRDVARGWFETFNDARREAQERRQVIPLRIGPDEVGIARTGIGSGHDSHKEVLLHWRNVKVGLSERSNPTRQLHNASLQVSGAPCLITGFGPCWEFFRGLVDSCGGTLIDEWVRRVDVCIDLPNIDFDRDVEPLLDAGQVVTRCRKRSRYEIDDRRTGFVIGNSQRMRMQIYDKVLDCISNHDAVYVAAMIQRRWDGEFPGSATRFEWQLGREWWKQYDLDTAAEAIARLPDVFEKLTEQFRITSTVPDRANKHQSRTPNHPLWNRVIAIGQDRIGVGNEPLRRLDRSQLDESRAVRQIIGFGTSIADRRGTICETTDDLLRVIRETIEGNGIKNEEIFEKFRRKAKTSGTWEDIFSFPGKEAA